MRPRHLTRRCCWASVGTPGACQRASTELRLRPLGKGCVMVLVVGEWGGKHVEVGTNSTQELFPLEDRVVTGAGLTGAVSKTG